MKSKLLTKQIAEQFIAGEIDTLDEFTSIEDAAAIVLATFGGDSLSLNGLTNISNNVAKALASFKGCDGDKCSLNLEGLECLSEAAAQALACRENSTSLRAEIEIYEDAVNATQGGEDVDYPDNEQAEEMQDEEDTPSELEKALASGDLVKVKLQRSLGLKLWGSEGFYEILTKIMGECIHDVFSAQSNPDLCKRVVSFAELDAACGPFYEHPEAAVSLGSRPDGWASATINDRILSWVEVGYGILGDQCINVDKRLVSTKPMTAFIGSLVAGPLSGNIGLMSETEEFLPFDFHRAGLDAANPDILSVRSLIVANMASKTDVEWTKGFSFRQFTKEILLACANSERYLSAIEDDPDTFEELDLYLTLQNDAISANKTSNRRTTTARWSAPQKLSHEL